jgi:hypothetical protein
MRIALAGLAGLMATTGLSAPVVARGQAEVAPAPTAATRHFENSIDRARTAVQRDQYSDFSFDYPEDWGIRPNLPKDDLNYVEAWGPGKDGGEDYGFSIGWIGATGYAPKDVKQLEELARKGGTDPIKNLPDYRFVRFGPQRVGRYDSLGWQFTVKDPNNNGRVVHGRTDLILPPGAMRGIVVVSTTVERPGGVRDPGEIGATGGMKAIFDSLRLEPDGPNATRRFVNSPERARSAQLRDQYLDFSFDYPAGWGIETEPGDGTAANFVSLDAPNTANGSPIYVCIGAANGTGNPERDLAELEPFAREQGTSLLENATDFRIVSVGPQTVGGARSLGWRFTAMRGARGEGRRPVKVFGRVDILISPGSTRGVVIIAYVTDEDKAVAGPERLGDAGPLKLFYDSFALGK